MTHRQSNRLKVSLTIFLTGLVFVTRALAAPISLDAAYQQALQRSETVRIRLEEVRQAEERYRQSRSALFPTINAVASYQRLDTPPGPASSLTEPDRPEVKLTLSQPVFRGLRDFAGLRASQATLQAVDETRRQAELDLYVDVAQNFYSILGLEADMARLRTQIQLDERRISELQGRIRIGRSRQSEILAVRSAMALLEAQVASIRGQIAGAREAFAYLTGLDPHTPLVDDQAVPSQPPNVDEYLVRLENRPELRAQIHRLEAAEESVWVARGAHLPSVDLLGNWYFKRSGVLQEQQWDVAASLTVPIFSGGMTQSQVRQAVSVRRQAEESLGQQRRQAVQAIRTAASTLETDIEQVAALEKAVLLAERNYREQSREYRLGLVTNLDVLQSLNAFQDAARALDRARFVAKLDRSRLEATIGQGLQSRLNGRSREAFAALPIHTSR